METTARLLQERGYHGAGLRDVLAKSGSPRGSLYFHYPGGKEELAAEAIAYAGARMTDHLRTLLAPTDDIGAAIARITSMFEKQLVASGFKRGCPVGPTALEDISGAHLREAMTTAFVEWHEVITERLRREGHSATRAAALATFGLAAIEGALLLAKAKRDVGPLRCAALELGQVLRSPSMKRNRRPAQPRRKTKGAGR